MTGLDAVREYHRRGWRVVPVPTGQKRPVIRGWQNFWARAEDLARLFGAGENISVIVGSVSGDLVDIDLDCSEVVGLVDLYLPITGAIFGRPSKPRSHWLYIAPGAVFATFIDPLDGATLLELRADGREGAAHLTLLPPSLTSGERREWSGDVVAPRVIDSTALRDAVAWLAVGSLVARHVSQYAAERPDTDFVGLLDEIDILEGHGGKLGGAARRWLNLADPVASAALQQRRPNVKRHSQDDFDLAELMDAIPNDCAGWDDWNRAGLALFAASAGSADGFAAFDSWSRKSPKYDPRTVAERWDNYRRSPPTRISIGSLLHVAREHGWSPRGTQAGD